VSKVPQVNGFRYDIPPSEPYRQGNILIPRPWKPYTF